LLPAVIFLIYGTLIFTPACMAGDSLEKQFRELPMEAKRLTGPLFWLHGDANETKQRLEEYIEVIADGGNGCFTAESRPHSDWLGPGWYRDLDICLQKAKKLDLKMWIFDEKWWPSQTIERHVPPRYAAKQLDAIAEEVSGPGTYKSDGYAGERYIGAVAGRIVKDGAVDGDSLVDLSPFTNDGTLKWQVPKGKWKVIKFTHKQAPGVGQGGKTLSVDGASRDCTDWFIQKVYQPHYDHFQDDFGKTIPGFFYDEPKTKGDWGTELNVVLKEWKVDWKKAYVAYKFKLAGDDDTSARYQYLEAFAEAWGRVMYGGMTKWCREHDVISIGHFMEHKYMYYRPDFCAGDMMRLQKYSAMGGMDLVCRQMYPGQRPHDIYQTPKLCSSVSHVYGKKDDLAMCETFGGYNQALTYPQMKWLTDQMQVRGVNFMIPHAFNPKSPYDSDFPPYFYNSGLEPRWPLYRVYADWTSRLSLMLTGGRHVCPVAILFSGNAKRVGRYVTPEDMTSAIQDAVYDCDWLPFEAFESDASVQGRNIVLHKEKYQVLVVPPSEVIPRATLEKARDFLKKGGTVIGYGILPSKSGTVGCPSQTIVMLSEEIWGKGPHIGTGVCKTTKNGGRSYYLPEKPAAADVAAVLKDAGIPPVIEVLDGDTGGWLHVLHRVKEEKDVFFICNQNHTGKARKFRFRIRAKGVPEVWDAMRNEITSIPFKKAGTDSVEVDLVLEPSESVLLVFNKKKHQRPLYVGAGISRVRDSIAVVRDATPPELIIPSSPGGSDKKALKGCKWVWYPEKDPLKAASPGKCYFRGVLEVPAGSKVKKAFFVGTCDNAFTLCVNGKEVGRSRNNSEAWRNPTRIVITSALTEGRNILAIEALNMSDKATPAGLIGRYEVDLDNTAPVVGHTNSKWKSSRKKQKGWRETAFDDSGWRSVKVLGNFGCVPWGNLPQKWGRMVSSPVKSNPFYGHCDLPEDVEPRKLRIYLETSGPRPEDGMHVTVNGKYAGGFICGPYRLEISRFMKKGKNQITIQPFAPESVRLAFYPDR